MHAQRLRAVLPVLSVLFALSLSLPVRADSRASRWTGSAGQNAGDHRNPHFRLELSAAATVTLQLTSPTDAYLYLANADGSSVLAQDDDGAGGTNSKISLALNAGKYLVTAATYNGNASGEFTLSSSMGTLSTCFYGYQDANYSGASTMFCEGGTPMMNDAYSSFRVPAGLRVRVFENSDQSGVARTYFSDVPFVGGGFNDLISGMSWGGFARDDFSVLFASDPQFSWGYCPDDPNSALCQKEKSFFGSASDEQVGRTYNGNLTRAMNNVAHQIGAGNLAGAILNGDLTEFGDQGPDLPDYITFYEHGLDMNVYLGLGNHDYANNVDDCGQNTCASSMIWYLARQVPTLNPLAFDYSESGVYYKFPSLRKDHKGSLGYSWDVGNVHFVQLNNYATYTRSWNGWNFSGARRDYFDIGSAIAWLRQDLQNAAGKKIILNLHDWGSVSNNSEFNAVLNDFPVSAVFAGHYHASYGQYDQKGPFADGKRVPALLSGSAHYGTFLVARFTGGKIYVWVFVVDHFNGAKLQVRYAGKLYDASNLGGILNVSPGSARYYDYLYDQR